MKTLIILAMLTFSAPQDGSIVFVSNTRLGKPVIKVTQSELTHSAIVLYKKDQPYVYEANLPKVKRSTLEKFCKKRSKRPIQFCFARPKIPFTQDELQRMKLFANNQLGRRYSLKGYTKFYEGKGIHCSQFVTKILIKSDRAYSNNPGRVSPKNLWLSIEEHFIFSHWLYHGVISSNPPRVEL